MMRMLLALLVFSKRENIGENIAIEMEYAAKTMPCSDVGTPLFRASCG